MKEQKAAKQNPVIIWNKFRKVILDYDQSDFSE